MISTWMNWTNMLRVPGHIIFSVGALAMFIFVLRAIWANFRLPVQPVAEGELLTGAGFS